MNPPRNARDRLQRLLVMLPWLMEMGEVSVAEVAHRFDMSEEDVQTDLELVAMCGLPPFVDEMIDVFVDEGTVFVGVPRLFTRPLRLTAPEGFALLAAGRAAMELPGADPAGPLGRGLDKLSAVLDDVGLSAVDRGGDPTAGVVIELDAPPFVDQIAEWTASGSEALVSYYSPDRDVVTDRTIVPRHVFAESGHWYVLADDSLSGERRTFRIDRIESMSATGRQVSVEVHALAPGGFFTDVEVERAVLRLAPAAAWIAEQYPIDESRVLEDPPGWVEVRLPVTSSRWLSRLLIRLGGDAVVVESPFPASDVATLARRVLANYD
jgi:proteasome accessory factor C